MAPEIYTHTDHVALHSHLTAYLPHSLPLLRRIKFMSFAGGKTPDSKLLSSCPPTSLRSSSPSTNISRCFVFAYVDFSRGPETEMWLFSSLELYGGMDSADEVLTSEEEELCHEQILALFGKLKEIESSYLKSEVGVQRGRETVGVVNCGALHECVVKVIEERGLLVRKTVPTQKFLYNIADLAPIPELPGGLKWAVVPVEDIEYVLTKTSIRRKLRTVKLLPSAAVVDESGSLAAWAFLGVDASLTHLYVEEAYRGLGLAKAVSLKLYHESIPKFGNDGIAHADVEIQNLPSQAVAEHLGGVRSWIVHWTWIQFSSV